MGHDIADRLAVVPVDEPIPFLIDEERFGAGRAARSGSICLRHLVASGRGSARIHRSAAAAIGSRRMACSLSSPSRSPPLRARLLTVLRVDPPEQRVRFGGQRRERRIVTRRNCLTGLVEDLHPTVHESALVVAVGFAFGFRVPVAGLVIGMALLVPLTVGPAALS